MATTFLVGQTALSAFRVDALKKQLADAGFANCSIRTAWVYLLQLSSDLTDENRAKACTLLDADASKALPQDGLFVAPRLGTISPWSSKATDIFRYCGVRGVRRVEHAMYMAVEQNGAVLTREALGAAGLNVLHDRMIEGVFVAAELDAFFITARPARGKSFDVMHEGRDALVRANKEIGLAMSDPEIDYLYKAYAGAKRNPTDTELTMFGQVNSEHCRHKIFNAQWVIDGKERDMSLFGMIKNTHKLHPEGTQVAYKDNSGVIDGFRTMAFQADPKDNTYKFAEDQVEMLMKVETHNHPTAISPYPGAATGVGGEIRDESATGIGSRTKAGICGFCVSNLQIPGYRQPWEKDFAERPERLSPALNIMLEGPIGGAAFGNEFGRPQLCGFFRTLEEEACGKYWGYHKPIMLAGGMGNIRHDQVLKREVPSHVLVVQIGGPAMRIGLGGGAASSMASGTNEAKLDFDSVQRGNAEMQRRCQGVIDACVALGAKNPILSLHDIGAGGLSNGCPELVEATGADFELRHVHNEELSMSPMEIWCCEAQERYVLAIRPEDRVLFESFCERERCPVAFIGETREDGRMILHDNHFNDNPIDMDISTLLGKPPRMVRDVTHVDLPKAPLNLAEVKAPEALQRILRFPAVANKTFLVTITDRTITGMVHRDQMCGPYQLPVADHAVTVTGYQTTTGETMATGERTPIAVLDAPASGRMAVGEAILQLASAPIGPIGTIKLSANWMAACGEEGEDARLFDTVETVGMDVCPQLGVCIPVGKDSCSMRTIWTDSKGQEHKQVGPLSLIVSSFATVTDARKDVTPDLKPGLSRLMLIDLGNGKQRLGASVLAQVYNQMGDVVPDMDEPKAVRACFEAMQELVEKGLVLAYHDRSDGGVAVTLAEMAMAGGRGVAVNLTGDDPLAALYNEELGAVLQVAEEHAAAVDAILAAHHVKGDWIGLVQDEPVLQITVNDEPALDETLASLRSAWTETTYQMQALRDNPECAKMEFDIASMTDDPGLNFKVTYPLNPAPVAKVTPAPKMAILREEGVNGHIEMAAAFTLAGFEAIDVHMTDLLEGRVDLADFKGLVACGGFSYGDVLGAGSGWARSILFNAELKAMFKTFFERPDTFTLGVCNGCQMVSQLKDIIPGAQHWPRFVRNNSEQFEGRYCTLEVLDSPSVLLKGMAGSRLPIAVAHGEGRVSFENEADAAKATQALRFVDGKGQPTEIYPWNPNGSKGGLCGFTSEDGRATILMPHPERSFRSIQLSYDDGTFAGGEDGPWMQLFRNAYAFATRS
ncbi:MAG: phosphoribosylformylglycinamidine synthase [bacterium]|nr:phosphoribosylformylglycinamidine synthase [bacterium]